VRYDAGADERALAGSAFGPWLDATVAREQVLYGPDGEYAPDVFDPSGEEITPVIALRQAERALKQDPGAAGWAHARGVALTRLGRARAAVEALDEAAAMDGDNPWLWLDLGRAALAAKEAEHASQALRTAARLEPGLKASLARAVESAAAEGDDDARAEATALLAAIDPAAVPPPRIRLKVVEALEATEPPPRTAPPPRPPRPSRAGPPRSGGRRPGS
jgi:tetratricopeptide (TPR) repeat protein